MKSGPAGEDSLVVDISDALSERDRVRFTVQTRTKLPYFAKPTISVVRQHEEFIWLHDCLEDNDEYAGYIIPPSPPKPDFDASREKLQRLGDGEANMSKDEFSKMKQELEAEYLAIFKKTVAMHEIFLQRLAAHEKFKYDPNLRIFLEYENELSVRSKNKKEKLSGFIQNISRSAHDLVITTSQVAASSSTSSLFVGQSPSKIRQQQHLHQQQQINAGHCTSNVPLANGPPQTDISRPVGVDLKFGDPQGSRWNQDSDSLKPTNNNNESSSNEGDSSKQIEDISDEQYFQKERLILAMYYKSIKETAINSERVTQAQKSVAESYLHIAQQLVKLAAIEIVPITTKTKDSSTFLRCSLPSLTMPASVINNQESASSSNQVPTSAAFVVSNENGKSASSSNCDNQSQSTAACANTNRTSDGLKQFLLYMTDYLEQARKIESRIASDEDLKLTDTFLYYKRETNAASDLIARRQRFMAEFETATRNLEKSRQKSRGSNMQYADVIQKQAGENFLLISKLARGEIIDYKERRVAAFRKSFSEVVDLELKHIRSHFQLIKNCLSACRNIGKQGQASFSATTSSSSSSSVAGPSTSSQQLRPPAAASTSLVT